ncbi:hypothetical protein C5167_043616 [Papaver somniferum]|uniref:Uncharacterized protein n=1 Tax=Papaver somniferum TaxID=3469 RepID=A0A4Y7L764_PAPSO|nr:hypothetical protein C5167_043616 [Papaver somniferum]
MEGFEYDAIFLKLQLGMLRNQFKNTISRMMFVQVAYASSCFYFPMFSNQLKKIQHLHYHLLKHLRIIVLEILRILRKSLSYETMKEFYDNIPARAFYNFQFFSSGHCDSRNNKSVERVPLPPPLYSAAAANSSCTKPSPSPSSSFKQSSPPYSGPKPSVGTAPPASFSDFYNKYSDKLEHPMYFPNFPDMNFTSFKQEFDLAITSQGMTQGIHDSLHQSSMARAVHNCLHQSGIIQTQIYSRL